MIARRTHSILFTALAALAAACSGGSATPDDSAPKGAEQWSAQTLAHVQWR